MQKVDQMFETAGKIFFAALRDAVARRLGTDHACFQVMARATDVGDADATAAAQGALNALGGEMAAVLMADVHKALREDPAGVLKAWQPLGNKH
jgi:hypothetical protein